MDEQRERAGLTLFDAVLLAAALDTLDALVEVVLGRRALFGLFAGCQRKKKEQKSAPCAL